MCEALQQQLTTCLQAHNSALRTSCQAKSHSGTAPFGPNQGLPWPAGQTRQDKATQIAYGRPTEAGRRQTFPGKAHQPHQLIWRTTGARLRQLLQRPTRSRIEGGMLVSRAPPATHAVGPWGSGTRAHKSDRRPGERWTNKFHSPVESSPVTPVVLSSRVACWFGSS